MQTAGMPEGRREGHFGRSRGVGDLVLERARRGERRLPCPNAAGRELHVAAQRPLARLSFVGKRVEVVGEESLARGFWQTRRNFPRACLATVREALR